jgi:hypothetical protein
VNVSGLSQLLENTLKAVQGVFQTIEDDTLRAVPKEFNTPPMLPPEISVYQSSINVRGERGDYSDGENGE